MVSSRSANEPLIVNLLSCFSQNDCPAAVASKSCSGFRKPISNAAAANHHHHHHHHHNHHPRDQHNRAGAGAGNQFGRRATPLPPPLSLSSLGSQSSSSNNNNNNVGCRARAFGRFWAQGGGGGFANKGWGRKVAQFGVSGQQRKVGGWFPPHAPLSGHAVSPGNCHVCPRDSTRHKGGGGGGDAEQQADVDHDDEEEVDGNNNKVEAADAAECGAE